MKKSYIILLTTFIILFMNVASFAATSAVDSPKIRIGYFGFSGFQDKSIDGELSGYSYDYLNEIAKYTGWKYEYVNCSWSECLKLLKDKKIDLVGSAEKNAERELIYEFPRNDVGVVNIILVVNESDRQHAYNDYQSLQGMHVGLIPNNKGNEHLFEFVRDNNIKITTSYHSEKNIDKVLASGAIDAILTNSLYKLNKQRPVANLYNTPFYYMTYKGNKDVIVKLDNAISTIKSINPFFDLELYKKHYPKHMEDVVVLSEKEKNYLLNKPVIRVVYDKTLNPLQYYDKKTGTFSGTIAEIFYEISHKTGVAFNFIPVSSELEAFHFLKNGKADVISAVVGNAKNPINVVSTLPFINLQVALIRNKNSQDRKDLKFAVCRFRIHNSLSANKDFANHEYIFYENPEQCINAVNTGKADATYLYTYIAEYYMQTNDYRNIALVKMTDIKFPLSIGIAEPADVELLTILNKAIANISENEYNEIIFNSIYGEKPKASFINILYSNPIETIWIIAVFFILILIVVFLRNSMLQAKLANESKSIFLAKMSHEIRTPINAIVGFLRLLKDEKQSQTSIEYISIIEKSSRTLLELVNSILDVSKIESGKVKLDLRDFDITSELDSISRLFVAATLENNLILRTYIDPNIPQIVVGDQLKLRQVISNLLNNALKFTNSGGKIIFEVLVMEKKDGYADIRFLVKDSGIGISKKDISTIFNPFCQLGDGTISKQRGTGLGLTICRDFVKLMGGDIQIKSELDVGSEFFFTLKLKIIKDSEELKLVKGNIVYMEFSGYNEGFDKSFELLEYSATPMKNIDELLKQDLKKVNLLALSAFYVDDNVMAQLERIREQSKQLKILLICYPQESIDFGRLRELNINVKLRPIPLAEFNNIISQILSCDDEDCNNMPLKLEGKVLVAEDDAINSKLIKLVLSKYGLDVTVVSNGKLAFEQYTNGFDIIFMDINMPIMDGIISTEKIREDELKNGMQHIPIIAITANIMKGDEIKYKNTGINDILSKPFELKALESLLKMYLSK